MPQETFGAFKVVLSALSFVGAFCLMGTGQAVAMSASLNADGNLRPLMRGKIVANVVASLALVLVAAYYAWGRRGGWAIAQGMIAAAVVFPGYNTSDIWMAWLNGKSRFVALAKGRATVSVLAVVSILIAVVLGITDVWAVVLLYLCVLGLVNLAMLRRATQSTDNDLRNVEVLSFGRHTTYALLFGGLLPLDVLLLEHYWSATEVAIYAVALIFPEQMKVLYAVVNQVLSPRFFRAESLDLIWHDCRTDFLLFSLVAFLIGAIGVFCLPAVAEWCFSDRYAASAQYGKWLWLSTAIVSPFSLLGSALVAQRKHFVLYGLFSAHPVLSILLYVLLLPTGVVGFVWARILTSMFLVIFQAGSFWWCLRDERSIGTTISDGH